RINLNTRDPEAFLELAGQGLLRSMYVHLDDLPVFYAVSPHRMVILGGALPAQLRNIKLALRAEGDGWSFYFQDRLQQGPHQYRSGPDILQHALTSGPHLYHRPSFSGDERFFTDLVAFARGMNTSEADIRAVLEAEAMLDPRTAHGRIDPVARKLI